MPKKCIEFMEKKLVGMENRMVTVKGQKLSRADVEMIKLYAESFIRAGGSSWNGLVEPRGEIGKVLSAFKLEVSTPSW